MSQYQQVREFMTAFGQECPILPGFPSDSVCTLRDRLIIEEAGEHHDAVFSRDFVKTCDAICDLLYVVYGSAIAIGLNEETLNKMFAEVHRSNMSKMWSEDELKILKETYRYVFVEFDKPSGKYVVTNEHGKVIKSPSYSPPNLAQFLPCNLTSSTTGMNSPQSPSEKSTPT